MKRAFRIIDKVMKSEMTAGVLAILLIAVLGSLFYPARPDTRSPAERFAAKHPDKVTAAMAKPHDCNWGYAPLGY